MVQALHRPAQHEQHRDVPIADQMMESEPRVGGHVTDRPGYSLEVFDAALAATTAGGETARPSPNGPSPNEAPPAGVGGDQPAAEEGRRLTFRVSVTDAHGRHDYRDCDRHHLDGLRWQPRGLDHRPLLLDL